MTQSIQTRRMVLRRLFHALSKFYFGMSLKEKVAHFAKQQAEKTIVQTLRASFPLKTLDEMGHAQNNSLRRNKMKTLAYVLIGFVSIICLVGLLSSTADASDYLGDVCWQSGDVMIKLGVSYLGGSHFLLAGKMTNSDGTLHNIVNGNAEIVGNSIYGTLVHSGKDSKAMWSGIIYIVLDSATLSGTAEGIGNDRNYSDQPITMGNILIDSDTEHSTGSLTLISCP